MKDILFVDMDGTLCEFSVEGNILPPNVDWNKAGYFTLRRPVMPSIEKLIKIKQQYPGTIIIILTAVPTKIGQHEKTDWIKDYGLDDYVDAVVFVDYPYGSKVRMLQYVCKQNSYMMENVIMIDDDLSILFEAQDNGIDVMHVSTFICRSPKEIVQRP